MTHLVFYVLGFALGIGAAYWFGCHRTRTRLADEAQECAQTEDRDAERRRNHELDAARKAGFREGYASGHNDGSDVAYRFVTSKPAFDAPTDVHTLVILNPQTQTLADLYAIGGRY